MKHTLARIAAAGGLVAAFTVGAVVTPTAAELTPSPTSISAQAETATQEADPVTQLAAKAIAANPLAPQAAQANNGLAPGTYYKWTYTCDFKPVGGTSGNQLWAEYRADVWFGHVNMGCKPTGYKKWSSAKPTSPWYDYRGTRIR